MVARSVASSKTSAGATAASSAVNGAERRFKGVRMRSWGKWVSEIRLPNTRARLWLGSFATAEQAARAFDVAVVCLRGRSNTLNFPSSPPAYAPLGLPLHQIQELAAAAAASAAPTSIQLDSPSSSMSAQPAPAILSPLEPASSTHSELALSTHSEPAFSAQSEPAVSSQSDPAEFNQSELGIAHQSTPATTSQCLSPYSTMSSASPSGSSPSYSTSDDLEAATPPDTCSSTWQDTDSLQSSPSLSFPYDYLQEEQVHLELGVQWDELLWGSSLSSYSAWDQQLLTFPLLPQEDGMVETCLWNL